MVIPRSVRISLGLRPGMKPKVIAYNGRVEFLPVRKPAELRGLLRDWNRSSKGNRIDCERGRLFGLAGIKLAVSVVSCQRRRVEIGNSEWWRKRCTDLRDLVLAVSTVKRGKAGGLTYW